MTASSDPITVSLDDLKSGAADKYLPDAFGPNSLGILVVKGLPAKYAELRSQVLFYSSKLAALPASELAKLECAESNYLVGWSCGKEKLVDGKPDTLKGSYYVNCPFYVDPKLEGAVVDEGKYADDDIRGYVAGNLWPPEDVLGGFQACVKELCTVVINTASLVAKACDRYCLSTIKNYTPGYLEHIVSTSTTTKARLLHYFPPTSRTSQDNWCGEHLDHSCLTGLTSAMYIDELNSPTKELAMSPDPDAGLHIRNRAGEIVKVSIPRDCLAFQTGEALQVVTENQFRAVPHFVKGSNVPGVCRNTLAIFCQPSLHEMVGDVDFATFAKNIVASHVMES
ncbi:hypothetical protein V1517DRAFT_262091 [Lipomyces orientalis]|uniref:Uncharacterized protein n=1 Tax=Lipomyces orientalis TaxID=1233043 RepID=A0ACC3TKE5_9ASCO